MRTSPLYRIYYFFLLQSVKRVCCIKVVGNCILHSTAINFSCDICFFFSKKKEQYSVRDSLLYLLLICSYIFLRNPHALNRRAIWLSRATFSLLIIFDTLSRAWYVYYQVRIPVTLLAFSQNYAFHFSQTYMIFISSFFSAPLNCNFLIAYKSRQ